jgi:AcrR family transcriptional regulator
LSPRTRLDPDERREQILVVATDVFREQEYSAVLLEAVATRAGVTRGLLHHYFGSKRALYLEVVERAVRIPESVDIIPPDASGDLDEVVAACVASWMRMIETVGGLWPGVASPGGFAETDIDAVLLGARDRLVDRMAEEFPFPASLDRGHLRSALRCYSALARVATDEWLVRESLDRAQTEALLRVSLMALIESVVPAMETG